MEGLAARHTQARAHTPPHGSHPLRGALHQPRPPPQGAQGLVGWGEPCRGWCDQRAAQSFSAKSRHLTLASGEGRSAMSALEFPASSVQ